MHHIRDELLDEVIGLDMSKTATFIHRRGMVEKSKAIELHSASYNIMPHFS